MFLLIFSYVADLIFGDPEGFPHPVRGMGKLIGLLDNRLRGRSGKWKERIKGAILSSSVTGTSFIIACLLIESSRRLNPLLGTVVSIYLGYTTICTKDLMVKAKAILREIKRNNIFEARKGLSHIVGRDTKDLSKEKIIVATLESIAENTNDGIIAPLFYLTLGGPIWAMVYKAINTLDSMVGYKNEKYIHFGWFSAKLDDFFNFIPARISGMLIALASFIVGKDFKNSLKILLRDGKRHPSPNSGISEAAMAGALGVEMGGPSFYEGKEIFRPYIGKKIREIHPFLINEALNISFIASILMVSMGAFFIWMSQPFCMVAIFMR